MTRVPHLHNSKIRSDAGTGISSTGKHRWARQICPPGPCELCGGAGNRVHHKDGNWQNNDLSNLQRVCTVCHNHIHRPQGLPKFCFCGKRAEAKGYCQTHYLRWKRWGDPHLAAVSGGRWGPPVWRP